MYSDILYMRSTSEFLVKAIINFFKMKSVQIPIKYIQFYATAV